MNISYPPVYDNIPPAIKQLGHEFPKAVAFLLIPVEFMYFAIYFHRKGFHKLYNTLALLSLATFWIAPVLSPISCGPARCLQNFAGTSIHPYASPISMLISSQLQSEP
jgi:hypothetical protein